MTRRLIQYENVNNDNNNEESVKGDKMRKLNNLFPIVIFLVLALFLVITSCDRRNPPPTGIGIVKPSEVVKNY